MRAVMPYGAIMSRVGRMERPGAQVARQPALGLQHDDRDSLLAQRERAHQPGRAGAGDDYRELVAIACLQVFRCLYWAVMWFFWTMAPQRA